MMSETKEIQSEAKEIQEAYSNDVSPLAQLVLNSNMDASQLEKLFDLQERFEANRARAEFHKALANFKAEAPQVVKNKNAEKSKYATLGYYLGMVTPYLSKHGLSLTFKTEFIQNYIHEQKQEIEYYKVTAILSHALGHQETTSLTCKIDLGPKNSKGSYVMNSIQAIGSLITYLERYTGMAILGLATVDQDDDAALAQAVRQHEQITVGPERITSEQLDEIKSLIDKIEQPKEEYLPKMYTGYKINDLSEIRQGSQFENIINRLREKASVSVLNENEIPF